MSRRRGLGDCTESAFPKQATATIFPPGLFPVCILLLLIRHIFMIRYLVVTILIHSCYTIEP
jgi:hypothetical protein